MSERTLDKIRPELQAMLDNLKDELVALIKPITDNIAAFTKTIEQIGDTASKALELAEANANEILALKDHVNELHQQNLDLQERNKKLMVDRVKVVERNLEDRTNRSLRKTLVIKGIPEVENETWAQIERAHRSAPSNHPDKKGKRDLYAAFYDWKDSEQIKFQIIKANREDPDLKTYFEQKYGAITTARRGAQTS